MRSKQKTFPSEYIDYLLIKELYHCTPSELEEQDEIILQMHAEFMRAELKQQMFDQKRAEQQAKIKRR